MSVASTRSVRRWRVLAALQAALIVASMASPLATFAAIVAENATVNGTSSVNVAPSESITGAVTAKITANNPVWHGTGWLIATTNGPITACANTTDHNGSGTFTVSFTMTAPVSAGVYNAYFTLYSDSTCSGASVSAYTLSNAVTVAVVKQDQTITFDPLPNRRPDQMPVTVSATASSSLPVTFSSGTPAVCTVSGTTVSYVANGSCTVHADQAGDATHNPATRVSQSFLIGPADQTITFDSLANKLITDADFAVSATATSGLTVSFSSGTLSVCTVTGDTVDLVAIGTCMIDANQAGNANWNAAQQVTQSFEVTKVPTTTTVSCLPGPFTYTGAAQEPCSASVSAPGIPSSSLLVSYANNINAGTATASASFPETADFLASSDSTTFTIGKAATTTTVTCPASVTYTGSAQEPCTASVTGPGLNQALTVTYTNNTDVGTATASADFAGDSNHNPSSDTGTFTINGADQATLVITGPASKTFGDIPFIPATSGGSGTGDVTFTSLTSGVCTASGDTVTIVASGTCTITATKAASGNYNAATSVPFDIAVGKAVTTTTVVCPAGPFTYTGAAQEPCTASFTAPGFPSVPLPVTHTNNINAGTATASATFLGADDFLPSSDTEIFTIGKADPVCTISGWTGTYDGTAHGASGSCLGVMGEALTGLDLGASFTDVPGGTANWVYTDTTGNYNDANGSANIVIGKAAAVCAITGWTGPYDGSAHGASGTCTGIGGENAGTLDLGASFTDIPGGTASWTFTGNGNYGNQSGSADIVIEKIDQAITFPSLPNITTSAKTVTLTATTDSGLPVTYTSLTPGVCTVSGNVVTIVGTGTCTIEASQPGDATHAQAEPVRQSFTVASGTTPPTSTRTSAGVAGPGLSSALVLLPVLAGLMALVAMLLGLRARAGRDRNAWD